MVRTNLKEKEIAKGVDNRMGEWFPLRTEHTSNTAAMQANVRYALFKTRKKPNTAVTYNDKAEKKSRQSNGRNVPLDGGIGKDGEHIQHCFNTC